MKYEKVYAEIYNKSVEYDNANGGKFHQDNLNALILEAAKVNNVTIAEFEDFKNGAWDYWNHMMD